MLFSRLACLYAIAIRLLPTTASDSRSHPPTAFPGLPSYKLQTRQLVTIVIPLAKPNCFHQAFSLFSLRQAFSLFISAKSLALYHAKSPNKELKCQKAA